MKRASRDRAVAAVVLAAGRSVRFGESKALARWRGTSLVRRAVATALGSAVAEVIVVVGADGDAVAREIDDMPVRLVSNPRFRDGLSTSVGAAVNHLQADAALFVAVDQPALSAAVLDRLVAQWSRHDESLIVPTVAGERRSPVLVDRALFPALEGLVGDRGVRQLFAAHAADLLEVPFDDPAPFCDVDTPDDWRRLDEMLG